MPTIGSKEFAQQLANRSGERVILNPTVNDVRIARAKVVAGGDEDTDVQTIELRAMPGSRSGCSLKSMR